jgi:hypothetical protein
MLPSSTGAEPPPGSLSLGRWFGIDVYLEAAILLPVALIVLPIMQQIPGSMGLILGLLLFVMLFGSVLLHEFGHALMARRCGVGTRRISLGMLGGVEEDIKVEDGHATLTDPAEAELFIKQTGCDSLACAIGTSHGAFKFKGKQSLHFDVLEKIKARVPGFPLVMHGSSSVPQDEVARINAAGGKIADSSGVNVEEYLPAAKLGVTKINIDTDGRLVWTRVHREFFRDKPSDFDFRPPGKIFMEEYAKFIASRNQLLGSAGQLDGLRESLKA